MSRKNVKNYTEQNACACATSNSGAGQEPKCGSYANWVRRSKRPSQWPTNPQRAVAAIPDAGNANGHDQRLAQGSRASICQRALGSHSPLGYSITRCPFQVHQVAGLHAIQQRSIRSYPWFYRKNDKALQLPREKVSPGTPVAVFRTRETP